MLVAFCWPYLLLARNFIWCIWNGQTLIIYSLVAGFVVGIDYCIVNVKNNEKLFQGGGHSKGTHFGVCFSEEAGAEMLTEICVALVCTTWFDFFLTHMSLASFLGLPKTSRLFWYKLFQVILCPSFCWLPAFCKLWPSGLTPFLLIKYMQISCMVLKKSSQEF